MLKTILIVFHISYVDFLYPLYFTQIVFRLETDYNLISKEIYEMNHNGKIINMYYDVA